MNGPEHRWRKRLDARAERRTKRRQGPKFTRTEQMVMALQRQSRLLELSLGASPPSDEQIRQHRLELMERQRPAKTGLLSGILPNWL